MVKSRTAHSSENIIYWLLGTPGVKSEAPLKVDLHLLGVYEWGGGREEIQFPHIEWGSGEGWFPRENLWCPTLDLVRFGAI